MKIVKKVTEELDVSNDTFFCSFTKIKETDNDQNENIEFDKVVLKRS